MRRLGPVLTAAFAVAASEGRPSIGADGELPAGDEEAIFKHYVWPTSQAAVSGGWPAAEPPD